MIGQNLFIDEMRVDHISIQREMMEQTKFFDKAIKALSKLPVQYKVWTSAFHNDYVEGGIKLEVYDNRGRTIGSIQITYEFGKVQTDYIVTTNKLRTYTDWIKYLSKSVKQFYK